MIEKCSQYGMMQLNSFDKGDALLQLRDKPGCVRALLIRMKQPLLGFPLGSATEKGRA